MESLYYGKLALHEQKSGGIKIEVELVLHSKGDPAVEVLNQEELYSVIAFLQEMYDRYAPPST